MEIAGNPNNNNSLQLNSSSKEQFLKSIAKTSLCAQSIKDARTKSKKTGPPSLEGVVVSIYDKRVNHYTDKTSGAKKDIETISMRIFVLEIHPVKSYEGKQYGTYESGKEDNNGIPYLKLNVKPPDMKKFSPVTHDLTQIIPSYKTIKTFGSYIIQFDAKEATDIKPSDLVTVHCLRGSGYYPKLNDKTTTTSLLDQEEEVHNQQLSSSLPSRKNTVSISAISLIKKDFPDWLLAERLMKSDTFYNTLFGSYKEMYDEERESCDLMPEQFFVKVQYCQNNPDEDTESSVLKIAEEAYEKYERNKDKIPYSSTGFYSEVNNADLFIDDKGGQEKDESKHKPFFTFTIQLNQQFPDFKQVQPSLFEIQAAAYESSLKVFQIPNLKSWSQIGQCIMKHFTGILALDLNLKKTMGVTTHNQEATGRICTVLFMITRVSEIYTKIGIPISNKSEVIIFADRGRSKNPKDYQECINVGGSGEYSSHHLKTSKTAKFYVVTNVKDIEKQKWFDSLTPEKGDSLMKLLIDEEALSSIMKKKKKLKEGEKLGEIENIAYKIRKQTENTGFYYEVFAILPVDKKISDQYEEQVKSFASEIENLSMAKSIYTLSTDYPEVFETQKKYLGITDKTEGDKSEDTVLNTLPTSDKNLLMPPPETPNKDDNNNNLDEQKNVKKAKIEEVAEDSIQESQEVLNMGSGEEPFEPEINFSDEEEAEKPKKHKKEKHSKKHNKKKN